MPLHRTVNPNPMPLHRTVNPNPTPLGLQNEYNDDHPVESEKEKHKRRGWVASQAVDMKERE